MAACVCYLTVGSRAEGLAMARAMIAERLAASANLIPGVQSVYRWAGRVEEAEEVIVVLKTRTDLCERLVAAVTRLHSYQCPGILTLPIAGGNPDYLTWIEAETGG